MLSRAAGLSVSEVQRQTLKCPTFSYFTEPTPQRLWAGNNSAIAISI